MSYTVSLSYVDWLIVNEWMFEIFPTVRLAVTTKYQGNGFAAEVLLGRD